MLFKSGVQVKGFLYKLSYVKIIKFAKLRYVQVIEILQYYDLNQKYIRIIWKTYSEQSACILSENEVYYYTK